MVPPLYLHCKGGERIDYKEEIPPTVSKRKKQTKDGKNKKHFTNYRNS